MYTQFKNGFWAFCLLAAFLLYSIGQILLLVHERSHADLYTRLSKFDSLWVNAHLILMLSLLLMIPAFLAIGSFLKNRKHPIWFGASFVFTVLSILVQFGQFSIDLCLTELFELPKDEAIVIYEKLRNSAIVEGLFYDNSKIFSFLRYLDLWFLGQICLAGAFLKARKLPMWSLIIFFLALMLTQLGALIFPVFGKTSNYLGYIFYSIAYIPIAINIVENKRTRSSSSNS